MRLEPGTRVGPYEVLGLLGAGGMARVYRAKDTRLGRDVALKVVSEALGGDGAFLERFQREAKLVGSLNHPNIVALYDVGLHDGQPYFVAELLQGESLRERLSKGPLGLGKALEWAAQMATGLAAAHERGIVHRDLKPENIFVTKDGQVKLLDFGIAKLVEAVQAAAPHGMMDQTASPSGSSTGTGMVLGTPGYMSPEQVRGEPVDSRSDSFSFGAVLYEMLAGQRAFAATGVVERGYAILHTEPEALPASVPGPVVQLVHRCMEKDKALRFQSARDLAFHLELLRAPTGSGSASAQETPVRRGWPWWWWLLPLSTAGAVVLLLALRIPPPKLPSVRPLTWARGRVFSARFGPDGRSVFFAASFRGEPPRVYSTTVDRPDYHPLGIDDAVLAAVSSSGELALLLRPVDVGLDRSVGTLALAPGVGGAPREVTDAVIGADFAPDGAEMAVVRKVTGRWRLEFPVGHVLYSSTHFLDCPRIAPAGDAVAVLERPLLGEPAGKLLLVQRNGETRALLENWSALYDIAWARTGADLWLAGDPSLQQESLWVMRQGADPVLLYRTTGGMQIQDIARDGRALVLDDQVTQDVAVVDVANQNVTDHLGLFDWASLGGFSADGRSIVFSETGSAINEPFWVYLRKTDGSEPVKLGEGRGLALSPDGKWAMAARDDQPHRLWLLPTGAGASRSLDLPDVTAIRSGVFLPDGKRVAVAARANGLLQGYLVDLETGQARQVTPPLEEDRLGPLAVSPDGRLLAAVPVDGVLSTYSTEGSPGKAVLGLPRGAEPAGWGPRGLLVRVGSTPPVPILRAEGDGSAPVTTLTPKVAGPAIIFAVRMTPDEKTVAYSYRVHTSSLLLLDFAAGAK